ncbi:acyl-CoA dehydrogenase family protein [Mycolicibacterium mengxianglii]|uniref:acyl-CoA dehydrogenase family protein n=1 Tax=Mycolicibacterium mengxianglii TaxID=2736649 RepID=UPI0018D05BC1|nr:acyl-CoA dehydrogenase family protein [Mycolicibacterium mengxianglii]
MTAAVSEELDALRAAVSEVLAKYCSEAQLRAAMATDTGHDTNLWNRFAEMGLPGLLISEEFGGAGAGHVAMGVVMEEMGAALAGGPFLATAVLTTHVLNCCGDEQERHSVLPRIAAGELLTTVAFAEPASPPSIRPRCETTGAEPTGDGGWELTGEKAYVLDACSADLIYVLARTSSGPGLFVVDRGATGLEVSTLSTVDHTRKQCRIVLQQAPGRLVGDLGEATSALNRALDLTGVALVSEQAGGTRRAMQMAVDYAKTRFQFGRAIGSFQAVKHMCADMLLEAESAISAARHVAEAFEGQRPGADADLALAQAYCSEAYLTVAATGIQVHGGIGFTWEHPAHLYLRRARTDAQLLGDPATHRENYLQRVQS